MKNRVFWNLWQATVFLCLIAVMLGGCGSSSAGNLPSFSQNGQSYDGGQWSPDGQWFAAPVFGSGAIQLFGPTGDAINTIQTGCGPFLAERQVAWLPDGRLSCFWGNNPPLIQIMTLNQNGQIAAQQKFSLSIMAGAGIYDMQWNPHHDWLATIAQSYPGSAGFTLYISDVSGHNLLPPKPIDAHWLAWAPDGSTLALTENNGEGVTLLSIKQAASNMLEVTKARYLKAEVSDIGNLAWSPSGRWLVCRHASYNSEDYLFLLATDGSGKIVKITSSNTNGQLDFPAWSQMESS